MLFKQRLLEMDILHRNLYKTSVFCCEIIFYFKDLEWDLYPAWYIANNQTDYEAKKMFRNGQTGPHTT